MTPFELANTIDRELDGYTPKLSAAINKALVFHGEASAIITPGAKDGSDSLSFEESERIKVRPDESPMVIFKVMEAANMVESHSSWRLIVDTKPADKDGNMELRYTLIRDRNIL